MPRHAMHPIQDLFLESFSYVLQFDMHFFMHSYVDKNFIPVKSGCYSCLPRWNHHHSLGGLEGRGEMDLVPPA
jgi:hypothetical protein